MTAKPTRLAQAVAQLEATRVRTNPLGVLREWRIATVQALIRPKKGKR